jgi:N-acetylglucosamine malate deacetylase 1
VNVIAFGAHPDDVDLYAGGLVAGLARRGADVLLVDLTAGEMGTRGTPEIRAAEAAEAARLLGVRRTCLHLPDGRLAATDDAQNRVVVEAMRAHPSRLVLAPWEVDLHPDHLQACLLVRRARFFARVTNYPASGETHRPGPILYYEQKIPFEPDVVVDIGKDVETKRAAIRAFGSQFFRDGDDEANTEISDPSFHEMLEGRARVHGARIGVTWGEGYRRDGPSGVHDPLHLLAGVSTPAAAAPAGARR